MQHVTVQVRILDSQGQDERCSLLGRQLEEVAVTQLAADHATCTVVFHVDPRDTTAAAQLDMRGVGEAVVAVSLWETPATPILDAASDTLAGVARAAAAVGATAAVANARKNGRETSKALFTAIGGPVKTVIGNAFGAAVSPGVTTSLSPAANAGGSGTGGGSTGNGSNGNGAADGVSADLSFRNAFAGLGTGALTSFIGGQIGHPTHSGTETTNDVLGGLGSAVGGVVGKAFDAAQHGLEGVMTGGIPAGATESLAFWGDVSEAVEEYQTDGTLRWRITARSRSAWLAQHQGNQSFQQQTLQGFASQLKVRVAPSVESSDTPREFKEGDDTDWAWLAREAANAGLVLAPYWARSASQQQGGAEHAELRKGFNPMPGTFDGLVWGRNLTQFRIKLVPTNHSVNGEYFEAGTKHPHRFNGVRRDPQWLSGASVATAVANDIAHRVAGGGDSARARSGPTNSRTQEEERKRLERESESRLGGAVTASGTSTASVLRAGDYVLVGTPERTLAGVEQSWTGDRGARERKGLYGLTKVVHKWKDGLYVNEFEATPWQDWFAAAGGGANGGTANAGNANGSAASGSAASAPAHGSGGAGAPHAPAPAPAAAHAPALPGSAIVIDVKDPSGLGRIRVRYAWMRDDQQSHWIRVLGLAGGNLRGVGALPSEGDEVLVYAVGGNPNHIVALGGLWNGVDRPYHKPGRQGWVTPAGNTLVFDEGERPGSGEEVVELYTREGKAWVQLAQKGPTGGPTVTVHSEGDLSLEAPNGQLRINARTMLTHVAADCQREVGGALSDHVTGAATVKADGRLALGSGGELAISAGGGLHTHAGSDYQHSGAQLDLHPNGGSGPAVDPQVPTAPASAWSARPVPPPPRPVRHTQDPPTPRRHT